MRGIILAAGRGRRLEPILPDKPKCLLPFGTKTLIQHQIAALVQNGITEIVVVVGYEQQQIRDHLKDQQCAITYVENLIFDSTNTIYSLWLCREFFNDGFIYFNADVLFDYRIVKRLCEGNGGSRLACVPGQCGQEEVKVIVREGRKIVEIGKHMPAEECYGEFIGIAKFAKEDNGRFGRILDLCVKDKSTWKYFFEYAVDLLCRERTLTAVDISDLPATEIDFPEDLQRAREQVLPQLVQLKQSGF
jgi:choline kinase